MLKDLIFPGSPGFTSKPQTPPLGNTPMPKVQNVAQNVNPQTGLTRTQSALLSPTEQIIAKKNMIINKFKSLGGMIGKSYRVSIVAGVTI